MRKLADSWNRCLCHRRLELPWLPGGLQKRASHNPLTRSDTPGALSHYKWHIWVYLAYNMATKIIKKTLEEAATVENAEIDFSDKSLVHLDDMSRLVITFLVQQ